ncbi:MAG: alpha/beta hydrolase, partial [Clostridiaceae bacterium]|nr:alpha/beta hydrolase [Clostridiaceae bacterium]
PVDTSANTGSETSEIPGVSSKLTAHVLDPVIMTPLLAAKKRWPSYPAEKIEIKAKDNTHLCGYFWRSEDSFSSDAVILLHGFMDSAAGMAYLAEDYHRRGFSVLSVDLRGHGLSGGEYIAMGYKDADDLLLWIAQLQKILGESARIILHGVSMGSSAVIRSLSLSEFPSKAVCLAVSDSCFSDYTEQMKQHLSSIFPGRGFQKYIKFILLKFLSLSNFMLQGFFFGSHSPKKALEKRKTLPSASVPVLFFHGECDSMVPVEMAQTLYACAGEPKKLLIVYKAQHIGSFFYDADIYMKTIEEFSACET